MAEAVKDTKIVTGKVRLSYAFLFNPRSNFEGDDPKYSTTLLIPKSDKETLRKLRAAQQHVLKTKFGKVPGKWKDTIHDGDTEADLETNPEYADHFYVSVATDRKPGIIDLNRDPILDSTEVYSGCYARVSLNAYAYDHKTGGKGVGFGLRHVQKVSDGEPLGGVLTSPEDDFDDDFADEADDLV